MAQKKKKGKRNTSHHAGSHHKRRRSGKRNTHHSHRHNPHREGTLNAVLEGGGGALAAGLGSHLIAENFLTAWNSGVMSYLVTAVIGGGIAWVGRKFVGNRFFYGGLAGTVLAVGYRIVEDMGATPAKAVSADVRDAQATAASSGSPSVGDPGRRRMGRMGTVVPFPFNVPQTYQVVNGNLVPVGPAASTQALPPGPAGGGSVYAGQAGLRGPRQIDRRMRY